MIEEGYNYIENIDISKTVIAYMEDKYKEVENLKCYLIS